MNLLLSGSGDCQATAGREERQSVVGFCFVFFYAGEKKKTLDGYINLISCYSNQSLDFQDCGNHIFLGFFLVLFFPSYRKQRV